MTDTPATHAPERRAPALILSAMLLFSLQDLVTKLVVDSVSVWQLQFIRSILVVTLAAGIAMLWGGTAQMRPSSFRWPLVRSGFLVLSYLFFYVSFPFLTLSAAAAAFFTGPLFMTIFAWAFLGERLGPRRVLAILAGFAGVLVIVRPGTDSFQPASLLPVASAVCYAMGVIVTRARCKDEPVLGLSMLHNLLYTLVAVVGLVVIEHLPLAENARAEWPFLATGWHPVEAWAMLLLAATAVTHICGVMAATRAYQLADTSRIAPLEYSYLIYAPLWDLFVWSRPPEPTTLAGMMLIALAGAFVSWREGRPARPTMPSDGEDPWIGDR